MLLLLPTTIETLIVPVQEFQECVLGQEKSRLYDGVECSHGSYAFRRRFPALGEGMFRGGQAIPSLLDTHQNTQCRLYSA